MYFDMQTDWCLNSNNFALSLLISVLDLTVAVTKSSAVPGAWNAYKGRGMSLSEERELG